MTTLPARPNYIDFAKIIGIYCVLVGHYVYFMDVPFKPNSLIWNITHFVTLFHMPFFFFVAGMLYHRKEDSLKTFLLKQCKTLLIPYVLLSVIIGLIYYSVKIIQGVPAINVIKFLIGVSVGGDFFGKVSIFPVGPIWFVYALFFIKLLYFLCECPKRKWVSLSLQMLLIVLGCVVVCINENVLPCRLDSILVGFIFFMCGTKLKNVIICVLKVKVSAFFTAISMSVILLLLYHFYLDCSIRQGLSINVNYYGSIPIVFIFSGFVGTFAVLSISKMFFDIVPLKSKKIVLDLSDGMIITLASHKIVFFCLSNVLRSESVFAMMFCSVFVLLITWLLIIMCEKNFPSLLGYRNARSENK